MESPVDTNEEIFEENVEISTITETNEDIVEITNDIQKPKKPRSQAQKDALKKAQETRRKNLALKKAHAEQQSILKHNDTLPEPEPPKKVASSRRAPRKAKVVYEDDPSSDEELIVVKRRPRKKQVKKKVVYQDESSDEEYVPPKKSYKKKKQPLPEPSSSEESSDSEEEREYSYQINRPLKYSDVFRFV